MQNDLPASGDPTPTKTLPDLLREGLDIVFVGINPSVFSAERGHYFARATNRFWPCLSRSILSADARKRLSVDKLIPEHDRILLECGFGFTDLVKRATPKASDLKRSEFAEGMEHLLVKLERDRPRIACFQGITGYRHVHRQITGTDSGIDLGLQPLGLGTTRIYLVPSPSAANAHFTPTDQTGWYDRLADCLATIGKTRGASPKLS